MNTEIRSYCSDRIGEQAMKAIDVEFQLYHQIVPRLFHLPAGRFTVPTATATTTTSTALLLLPTIIILIIIII